jgi:hypothetical protein
VKKISAYFDDALFLSGCGCILYGISLWSLMATWLAAGVMLIGIGYLYGKYSS